MYSNTIDFIGWPRALGTISPESNSIYGRKSDSLEDLKRPAGSPGNNANAASVAKHPRMMILKQGEGPRMCKLLLIYLSV